MQLIRTNFKSQLALFLFLLLPLLLFESTIFLPPLASTSVSASASRLGPFRAVSKHRFLTVSLSLPRLDAIRFGSLSTRYATKIVSARGETFARSGGGKLKLEV